MVVVIVGRDSCGGAALLWCFTRGNVILGQSVCQ
jgi:hypothetical protein